MLKHKFVIMLDIVKTILFNFIIGLFFTPSLDVAASRQVDFIKAPATFLVEGLQILETTKERTLLGCAHACTSTLDGAAFAYDSPTCHVMSKVAVGTPAFMYRDGFRVFMKPGMYRLLAYRTGDGKTDNPYDVYAGVDSSGYSNISGDFAIPLKTTYKHPILERWTDFPIKKVYLHLKKHTGVVTVVFNGARTRNKYDWMEMNGVVSSPWGDLGPGKPHAVMGVEGKANMRFYMSKSLVQLQCNKGYGWVAMQVADPTELCGSRFGTYPTILYSTLKVAVNWDNHDDLGFANGLSVIVDVEVTKG